MIGVLGKFKEFLIKQNALALAVGVIIGAAVGKVVSGVVEDLIMPLVGVLIPGGEWRNAELVLSGKNAIKYGDFLGRVVDFTIIAAVVFLLVQTLLREKPGTAPATKVCPECLESMPAAAKRCRACTSVLA